MKKRIVLCADDYGQAQSISNGIVQLLQAERLSAVSCMVTQAGWSAQARQLLPYAPQVDVGLHFNLTEGKTPLPLLMMQASLRLLDKKRLCDQFKQQIALFHDALGFMPQFIDGHQHVHQFPVVREALIDAILQSYSDTRRPYVRVINHHLRVADGALMLKKGLVRAMGTQALTRLLVQHGIPHNHSFSGMYHFAQSEEYRRLFKRFLQEIDDMGIIMCHPGLAAASNEDSIAKSRPYELAYLSSPEFALDCQNNEVILSRLPH